MLCVLMLHRWLTSKTRASPALVELFFKCLKVVKLIKTIIKGGAVFTLLLLLLLLHHFFQSGEW